MGRFYEKRIVERKRENRYFVSVSLPNNTQEIEVSQSVYNALDDLQREHWRIERREARHVLHLELLQTPFSSTAETEQDPEQALIAKIESSEIWNAIHSIPLLQPRRFILHALMELTVCEIAKLEHCSERAVKYSLALARKNLQKLLVG